MKFLLLTLISFNLYAGFVPSCENGKSGFYRKKSECENDSGRTCYPRKKGLNCEYSVIINEEIDDYTKPNYEAKSEVEICSSESDCLEKEAAKFCDHKTGHFKVRLEDNSEVYCTKILGYDKKLSGRKIIVEDAALKASYEAGQAIKQAEKNAVDSKVQEMDFGKRLYAMVQVLNKSKGLSKAVRKQLRKDLTDIRDDLFDGSICDAKNGILAVTVDGSVVKQSDIDTIVGKIDAYKTCP